MRFSVLFFLSTLLPVAAAFADDRIRFVAVGDVMTHQLQLDMAHDRTCDCWKFDEVFVDVKPYIERADWAIGNLETTLPGQAKLYSGYPQFGAPDSLVDALKWSGFDMLTLANNHAIDKGRDGVLRTRRIVREKGIVPLGSFADEAEMRRERIAYQQIRGHRFAFLDYTYGANGIPVPPGVVVNGFDPERLASDIALARTQADAVVVLFHYGTEYRRDPDIYQRYAVDLAFQNGADLVLGGHPHVLQPYETRTVRDRYGDTKERLVVWSLGNFVSNQQKRFTDGGMIFEFSMEKAGDRSRGWRFTDLGYIPVWVHIDQSGRSPTFRILPCSDYVAIREKSTRPLSTSVTVAGHPYQLEIREKWPRPVSTTVLQRIQLFYADTMQLLGVLPRAGVE